MKYVLGVLGVIFVVVLAVVLISRGGGPKQPTTEPLRISEQNREGTSVHFTTQGKLVGQDRRRGIRISISQNERRLEILNGYEEAVDRAYVYPNSPAAYETFLIALEAEGFDKKRTTKIEDERAVCPLGRRYIYELKEFSQEIIRLWNSTCGRRYGNFNGDGNTIRQLFQEQITDYSKRIDGVEL